jgi:hypothetical protein
MIIFNRAKLPVCHDPDVRFSLKASLLMPPVRFVPEADIAFEPELSKFYQYQS